VKILLGFDKTDYGAQAKERLASLPNYAPCFDFLFSHKAELIAHLQKTLAELEEDAARKADAEECNYQLKVLETGCPLIDFTNADSVYESVAHLRSLLRLCVA